MPGRTSNSASRSFSSPKSPVMFPKKPYFPPKTVTPSTTPAPQALTPAPIQQERPGFFSNMWTGFGLGSGQAIGHNMFRSDPVVKHVHTNVPKEYDQCMKDNNNDMDLCKQFLDD